MYCPNCGTENDATQSFCRACGMELKEVIQTLAKSGDFKLTNTDWLKKLGVFSLGCIGAAIICLLCVAVFSSIGLNLGASLVFMMILFAAALGILSVFIFDNFELKNALKSKRERENHLPSRPFERWPTNKKLHESTIEPIPSVTEPTTELFFTERNRPIISGELK